MCEQDRGQNLLMGMTLGPQRQDHVEVRRCTPEKFTKLETSEKSIKILIYPEDKLKA